MLEWQINDSGQSIPFVEGKPLCSKVNPQREAETWAEKIDEKLYSSTDLIIVLGVGAGYHLQALAKRTQLKIYVFEKIEELIDRQDRNEQISYLSFGSMESLWLNPKLREILTKKFQIFQHYPSTSPFVKDYDHLRHSLTARNVNSFKKQVEIFISNASLANVQFEEKQQLLSVKDIANHPSVNATSNVKVYIWKILGELLK